MKNEIESLKEILYNPIMLEKFKKFEENQEYFYYQDKEKYIKKLEQLIITEIKQMTPETYDIKLITSWFKYILQDYYLDDSFLLFKNEINKVIIDKASEINADTSIYVDYMVTILSDLEGEYYKRHLSCLDKYLSYKDLPYITNDEFERYVFALNKKKYMDEESFGFVFNKILDRNYKISEEEYKELFTNFSYFVAKKFDLKNVSISIISSERVTELCKSINTKGLHIPMKAAEDGHKILFKADYIKLENVIKNIKTLFHEIKHAIQYEQMNELYRIDVLKYVEDNVLISLLGEHYYNQNYKFISLETDANLCSEILLTQFLKAYAPNTYHLKKEELNLKIEQMQWKASVDKRLVKFEKAGDLQLLFSKVISENPEILKSDKISDDKKQILLQVYTEEGIPKTPDIYFKQKEILLEQMNNLPIKNPEELIKIKNKIDFYDTILKSFQYRLEDLERNLIALNGFKSTNPDINAEVFYYKNQLEKQLNGYKFVSSMKNRCEI